MSQQNEKLQLQQNQNEETEIDLLELFYYLKAKIVWLIAAFAVGAVIAGLIGADILILLSDIDGLFTDDPNTNPDAEFIDTVEKLDNRLLSMGKGPKSKVGTGGMATKLTAATIATSAGTDMIIANGKDFHVIHKIIEGRNYGTLFVGDKKEEFYLIDYIEKLL